MDLEENLELADRCWVCFTEGMKDDEGVDVQCSLDCSANKLYNNDM